MGLPPDGDPHISLIGDGPLEVLRVGAVGTSLLNRLLRTDGCLPDKFRVRVVEFSAVMAHGRIFLTDETAIEGVDASRDPQGAVHLGEGHSGIRRRQGLPANRLS